MDALALAGSTVADGRTYRVINTLLYKTSKSIDSFLNYPPFQMQSAALQAKQR